MVEISCFIFSKSASSRNLRPCKLLDYEIFPSCARNILFIVKNAVDTLSSTVDCVTFSHSSFREQKIFYFQHLMDLPRFLT